MGNSKKIKQAIDQVSKELTSMPHDEFMELFNSYKETPIGDLIVGAYTDTETGLTDKEIDWLMTNLSKTHVLYEKITGEKHGDPKC